MIGWIVSVSTNGGTTDSTDSSSQYSTSSGVACNNSEAKLTLRRRRETVPIAQIISGKSRKQELEKSCLAFTNKTVMHYLLLTALPSHPVKFTCMTDSQADVLADAGVRHELGGFLRY